MAILVSQVVIGRILVKLQLRVSRTRLGDAFHRRVDARDFPAALVQRIGHTAIAAAQFKQACLARRKIEGVQCLEDRR